MVERPAKGAVIGLGDVSAAARALMVVPEVQRAALMHRLLDETGQAARFQRCHRRVHPRLGTGTLMERALARPLAEVAGPGDPAYLIALAQVIDAVLDWRCGGRAG